MASRNPSATAEAGVPNGGSGAMFDAIADRYDLLNRVISLGVDRGWRRRTVDALALPPESTVLDLATGTGDLAFAIAERHTDVEIIGVDPSPRMLAIARRKGETLGLGGRVAWREGTAETLELEDGSVDAVTMAFGIRNVRDRPRALREMARVTKPGGRVAILELSEPKSGALASVARLYIHRIVPRVGAAISGAREYRYLERSIAAFPPPEEFVATMSAAGLLHVTATPLTFGVCCLYVGEVGSRGRKS
jgi:demethylmenaquinone methyltransferase / 2-methoxy-6-polyprenyl-1,4-benzoquinol methylase